MPPQQAYGLLDFVDDILDFRAHVRFFDASGFGGPEIERAGADVKPAPARKRIPLDQNRPPLPPVTAWLACGELFRISSGVAYSSPPMTEKTSAGPVPGLKASMIVSGSPS